eukprot:scaffold19026_cov68-Phaeocystis_antarctica.AAC.1
MRVKCVLRACRLDRRPLAGQRQGEVAQDHAQLALCARGAAIHASHNQVTVKLGERRRASAAQRRPVGRRHAQLREGSAQPPRALAATPRARERRERDA